MRRAKLHGDECPYCGERCPDFKANKCHHCGGALVTYGNAEKGCVIGCVAGLCITHWILQSDNAGRDLADTIAVYAIFGLLFGGGGLGLGWLFGGLFD